ncbi:MAG: glutathione S-transferase family protein [Hassallia sp.]
MRDKTLDIKVKKENMPIKLYDLAGKEDDCRFSPPCWRVKMALKHKGLEAEEIPWRFTEKEAIAFSGQGLVPVLVDGDKIVNDSWEIARYLETIYGDRPSLFNGNIGESAALFVKFWSTQAIIPLIFGIILPDLFENLHEKDKAYFRESREKLLGMTLEEFAKPNDETVTALQTALSPLREVLEHQLYLGGDQPYFGDYIVFGQFQWARAVSPIQLLAKDDPIYNWRDRLLDAFDGYARNASGYAV